MEKKNIYILIIVLAVAGTGAGIGIYYGLTFDKVPSPEDDILTIFGSGVTGNFSMTMTEIQSSDYTQFTNQEFITKNYEGDIVPNGNYSGVSLRSILEEENLLQAGAEDYTGIGGDGYAPGVIFGMLNISEVMNNDYGLCIIAYGGLDFDTVEDGSLKLMINQSIVDISTRASRYCVKNLTSIFIGIPEPEIFTIYGSGVTDSYSMTMTELESSDYVQVANQEFFTKNWAGDIVSNGNYSGVSLRSILEEETLLKPEAVNFTGIGADGYDPSNNYGMLNISEVMNNDYSLCIIAYDGPDFDPEDDAPIKLMINQSIIDFSIRASSFCVKNLSLVYIEAPILTIYGSGVTGNYSMTITQLQFDKYIQVTNKEFFTKNWEDAIVSNGNYSGVSLRSILEVEGLLQLGAENYTGIGLDDYNPGAIWGMLNISDVMNNDYDLCIIAYGGPDFDPIDDAPLRLMIDQSIVDISIRASRYCVGMLASIFIE